MTYQTSKEINPDPDTKFANFFLQQTQKIILNFHILTFMTF